ncbi:MAG: lamin tail domain-containing protein [Chloroflexota bacterium]
MLRRIGWLLASLCLPAALLSLLPAGLSQATGSSVVISEVAWGGTAASTADEWLELYNTGATRVELTGWTLSDGGDLNVTLVGAIAAGGFFLLERSDDSTISDVPADQIYSGSLHNDGESLSLYDDEGLLVDTANGDGGAWPAGSGSPGYFSMERVDPLSADEDSNWASNDGLIRNGLDANGNPINGTPGQPNSAWSEPPPPLEANVVIEAVLYDGYETNDADEAVQLRSLAEAVVDLSGWRLSDGSSEAIFPAGATLAAGEAIWLAWQADVFTRQFGFPPDWEVVETDPAVPNLLGVWPGFANEGDEVLLLTAETRRTRSLPRGSEVVDALVYEGGNVNEAGWFGPAVQPYVVSGVLSEEGQILYRRRDPLSGQPVPDTETESDWAQTTADVINGRKVLYPGWDLDAFFFSTRLTETAALTVAIAPDNAYATLAAEIESAQKSLQITSLTFESTAVAENLVNAVQRGVSVTLLLEGGPPGGLTDQEKYVCQQVEAAGGACWFMIQDSSQAIFDRYDYLHAKYILIDGRRVVIGSENLSPDSLPDDDKSDGTWGRRGVLVITNAPGVVGHVQRLWAADFDPDSHQDLFRWTEDHPTYGPPPASFVPISQTGGLTYTVRYTTANRFDGPFAFEVVQSPENSLRDQDGLLGLLAQAGPGDTILAEQLSERPHWGESDSNAATDPNPRLEALINAARRGARVRLLLDSYFGEGGQAVNGRSLIPSSPHPGLQDTSNQATCTAVNETARLEHLDLACRLGNPTGLGLHNKMILVQVDGRGYVHVGSLNGTEQASKANRELALQVQSDEAYALLADLFEGDWPHPAYLPILYHHYVGPAHYPLISEVLYDPSGLDDGEFMELVNPTLDTVDLSGYSLGDAVNPTDFEDVRRFPAGTTLPPGGVLVVALAATTFEAEYGFPPDFEILNTDPAVPDLIDDPAWGDPAALLQLGNEGDEVILRDAADQPVDVVTYGTGSYPGVVSCALVTAGHSLERYPYWRDRDDCPADFRDWPFPNPGSIP